MTSRRVKFLLSAFVLASCLLFLTVTIVQGQGVQRTVSYYAESPGEELGLQSDCTYPLTDVNISGPLTGQVDNIYTFDAVTDPLSATTPITYTW